MNRMIASSIAALAIAAAGYVHAADAPMSDASTCTALMKQFDQAAPAHDSASKIVEARAKRSTAETACKSGNYKAGISDLRAALNDIGVKPVQLPAS
jgi:hypothetical protein